MGNLRIWRGIPAGSRLEMGVVPPEGTEGKFTARARVLEGAQEWTNYDDEVLREEPPAIHPLVVPNAYVVRIRVAFADHDEASIRALVRKSDGRFYGAPYQYTVEGAPGDVARATLVLTTLGE